MNSNVYSTKVFRYERKVHQLQVADRFLLRSLEVVHEYLMTTYENHRLTQLSIPDIGG